MLTLAVAALSAALGLHPSAEAVSILPQDARPDVADGDPADDAAPELGWPRRFERDGTVLTVYEPQVQSWTDYAQIAFSAAFALEPREGDPIYGLAEFTATTQVDVDEGLVLLEDVERTILVPGRPDPEVYRLRTAIDEAVPVRESFVVPLPRVLAALRDAEQTQPSVTVNLDPPIIRYSELPAILVVFLGPPEFRPVGDTGLMFATNTNWDLAFDGETQRYYLLDGDSWYVAPDPLEGPWMAAAGPVPPNFKKLPNDEQWGEVRAKVPGAKAARTPIVFTATAPAELIVVDGAPQYAPVPGTALEMLTNSESVVFRHAGDGTLYYLVAGRWFRASRPTGPWSAATTDLPDDFRRIPADADAAFVRASVPGTPEAAEAVALASVPRKAVIDRVDTTIEVAYDGEPVFRPIGEIGVRAATNTDDAVLWIRGDYYCCRDAVWFVASSPTGPWSVADFVPAEVRGIPADDPLHHVSYVQIYDTTPTTVTTGYTAGYTGEYVTQGIVVLGAAALAAAVIASDDVSWSVRVHSGPAWYSYGCNAVYHGSSGRYYATSTRYGPYGGATRARWYDRSSGAWARGGAVHGARGSAKAWEAYNPSTNRYAAHAGARTPFESWGRSVVATGDGWVEAGHRRGWNGSSGWVRTSEGAAAVGRSGRGVLARDSDGTVYAGRDGNVYRRNDDGTWSKRTGDDWSPTRFEGRPEARGARGSGSSARGRDVDPGTVRRGLEQDARARAEGRQGTIRNQRSRAGGVRAGGGRSVPAPRGGRRR